jgi:hypothetical protein
MKIQPIKNNTNRLNLIFDKILKTRITLICSLVIMITTQSFSQLSTTYKNDFNQYLNLIDTYHPSINTKSLKALKDSISLSITDTNLIKFYNVLSIYNSRINCVHTNVYLPKNEIALFKKKSIFLPYLFKINNDSIFILIDNHYSNVLSINQKRSIEILTEIRGKLSSDDNIYYKNYILNKSFSTFYALYVNQSEYHSIELKDKTVTISSSTYQALLKLQKRNPYNLSNLYQSNLLKNENIAYLNISSFGINYLKDKKIKTKKLIPLFFKHIEKENIARIILDLRNNSGGNAMIPMILLKHLAKIPYTFYEKVAYKNNNYTPYLNLSESSFKNENNYYVRKKQFDYSKQKKVYRNHYKGTVYVLVNEANVSMSVAFLKKLINTNSNVILLGQPVGGNFNFNAGTYVQKELEQSKIKIKIPIEKIKIDSTQSNYIITPDFYLYDKQFIDDNGKIIFTKLIDLINNLEN